LQDPLLNSIRPDVFTSPYECSYYDRFEGIKEPVYIDIMPPANKANEATSLIASRSPSIDDLKSMESIASQAAQHTSTRDKWKEEYQQYLRQYLTTTPVGAAIQSDEGISWETERVVKSRLNMRNDQLPPSGNVIGASKGVDKLDTAAQGHLATPLIPHDPSNIDLAALNTTLSIQHQSSDLNVQSNTRESTLFSEYLASEGLLHPYLAQSSDMDIDWTQLGEHFY
jgi:hypothetical protein